MISTTGLKEYFTRIGMPEVVKEIDNFIVSENRKDAISRKYFQNKVEFAKNFGACYITQSCCEVNLYFECMDGMARELAENLGFTFYDCHDAWEDREGEDSEINIPRRWFDDIMHLWINKYKDGYFDIHQSKLKV